MYNVARAEKFALFSKIAAIWVMLTGVLTLMGWCLDISFFKSIGQNMVSMKVNAALCFVCIGIALYLFNEKTINQKREQIGVILTVFVLILSSLTLIEYILATNLKIDELILQDNTVSATDLYPGRMSPIAAISLILSSLALLLIIYNPVISQKIASIVLIIAFTGFTGYIFDTQSLYQIKTYTSIAVHATFSCMVLSLGIITARTRYGFMEVIVSDASGGIMARHMLPLIPLLLFLLGWIVLQGYRHQYFDTRSAIAIMVVLGIAFSCGLTLIIVRVLRLTDLKRQKIQDELIALNQQLNTEISERKQAEEEIHRLSVTDELTGILNRRGFLLVGEQSLKTARRGNIVNALIYIDLDGLKLMNDRHGHKAGDEMLIAAALVLKSCFREADVVARIGGDEFAIMTSSNSYAQNIIERIETAIAEFNKQSLLPRPLSLSMGTIYCPPTQNKSLLDLLDEADSMMYKQKQERRPHKIKNTIT